jgi:arsenite-transporting ATPase
MGCDGRVQDQKRAMDMVAQDPNLRTLQVIESPLFDLEIRGVPALKFMGDIVWH